MTRVTFFKHARCDRFGRRRHSYPPTHLGRIERRGGEEIHWMHLEVEEGRVRHSGQTELVDRNNEEQCASIPSDRRSEQLDENSQVDVTILAVTNRIELRLITAQSPLAPVWNLMVRVENNETAVKSRREATFLLSQIAQHQEN